MELLSEDLSIGIGNGAEGSSIGMTSYGSSALGEPVADPGLTSSVRLSVVEKFVVSEGRAGAAIAKGAGTHMPTNKTRLSSGIKLSISAIEGFGFFPSNSSCNLVEANSWVHTGLPKAFSTAS